MTISQNKAIGYKPNSPNAPQQRGKNWLLVIGIHKYADADVPTLKKEC